MYKYKSTLDKIREVLLPYSLEAKCDLATCMLTELVPHIEIISGRVHHHNQSLPTIPKKNIILTLHPKSLDFLRVFAPKIKKTLKHSATLFLQTFIRGMVSFICLNS